MESKTNVRLTARYLASVETWAIDAQIPLGEEQTISRAT